MEDKETIYFALHDDDGRIWGYTKLEREDEVCKYNGNLMYNEVWFTVNHGRVYTDRDAQCRQRIRDIYKKWGGVEITKEEYIRAVVQYVKTKEGQ